MFSLVDAVLLRPLSFPRQQSNRCRVEVRFLTQAEGCSCAKSGPCQAKAPFGSAAWATTNPHLDVTRADDMCRSADRSSLAAQR